MADGVRGTPDVGVLATRSASGGLAILLWHYHDDDVPGPDAHIQLSLKGTSATAAGKLWRVDQDHANAFATWRRMGAPAEPTDAQRKALVEASRLVSTPIRLSGGQLELTLPRQGVALLQLSK